MKFLVVLCAVIALASASPVYPYGYRSYVPVIYGGGGSVASASVDPGPFGGPSAFYGTYNPTYLSYAPTYGRFGY